MLIMIQNNEILMIWLNKKQIARDKLPKLHDKMISIWTDRRLRSYIGITLHTFVDNDW